MDATDRHILQILQRDGRASMRSIGEAVGLTAPAVRERVRRMEEGGIVLGYGARVAPAKVGLSVTAFMLVDVPHVRCDAFEAYIAEQPYVLEAHRITGEPSFAVRVAVPDMAGLQKLVNEVMAYGHPHTHIVLTSPYPWREVPIQTPEHIR